MKTPPQTFTKLFVEGKSINNIEVIEDVSTIGYSASRGEAELSNSNFMKVILTGINYKTYAIENCRFTELILDNCQYDHLTIKECDIKKLTFTNFKTGTLQIINNDSIEVLSIKNCETSVINLITNEINAIEIGQNRNNRLVIQSNLSQEINEITLSGDIPTVLISTSNAKKINLSTATNTIQLTQCKIVDINLKNDYRSITFEECTVGKTSAHAATGLNLKGGSYEVIKFIQNKNIGITVNRDNKGDDCIIVTLDICNTNLHVALNHCKIKHLLMNNFTAQPNSHFNFVQVTTKLLIESSNLEGCKFHNVNFSNADIRLLNSSLSNSKFINVEWPFNHQLYEYQVDIKNKLKREKLDTLWPLKESYRQLKVLSLDQHNKIDAVAFQKHEIKVYWKIVNLSRQKQLGNWFILFTNRVFSDFGQSIWLPLAWLLGVHSVLIYLLLHSFPLAVELELNPMGWDFKATEVGFAMFVNLLSPVHDSDLQNDLMAAPISIFGTIDFIIRVSSGYFLYYFIRATRKFNYSI
jgi:uncharacterized protein YjbI with pentapeptide repeats